MTNNNLATTQNNISESDVDNLFRKVSVHVTNARGNVVRSINTEMVKAYWHIGRDIVLHEQEGEARAKYGRGLIKEISKRLQGEFKRGFSVDILERARKFYLLYQDVSRVSISATVSRKSEDSIFNGQLSWSHYVSLMKVTNDKARQFYEIETENNNWTVRELDKQIASLLFDRLGKSKDPKKLKELAIKGNRIKTAKDIIKDPLILDFINMPENQSILESDLEQALINNLQQFLLELGKGFAFVARQKRITLESDHFYADLVFYHTILKCYVIIDLKTKKLTHGDLGQMQLYVNYFDQEICMENDSPTIGLVLCAEKNQTMVKYQLGENNKQIFASKYQFSLPTEKELQQEIKREIEEFEHKEVSDE